MTARWVTVVALVVACAGCASGASPEHYGPPGTPCAYPRTPPAIRAAPAAHRGLLVGLSASVRYWHGNQKCHLLAAVRATGAAAIREDLDWAVVSPRQGIHRWGRFDGVVADAARSGLIVLPILDGPPAWARGAGLERAYAAFTAAAVARYGPGGSFWRAHPQWRAFAPVWFELWNEPYISGNPDRLTAAQYANLVVAAVTAGRRVDSRARFLAAAEQDYIDAMFAARPDLGAFADGYAVHPYAPGPPAAYDPGGSAQQVGRVEAIHDVIADHGDPDAPLWITEVGWSTCSTRPPCVDVARQARNIAAVFALARGRWASYVRALFVYSYSNLSRGPTPPRQLAGYGLVDGNLRPKPALGAFKAGT